MIKSNWVLDPGKFLSWEEVNRLLTTARKRAEVALAQGHKVAVRDYFIVNLALVSTGQELKADGGRAPSLENLIRRYIENRTDLKPATSKLYELMEKYLLEFFGGDIRIDRITRAMAADWRAAMAKGKLVLNQNKKKIKEASVCFHVRNAKTIFNHAVREDLILYNPFDRLKGTAREPDKDWKYVTLEELDKLLDACSNWGWRMLIALCRLAGLRRGEALNLT